MCSELWIRPAVTQSKSLYQNMTQFLSVMPEGHSHYVLKKTPEEPSGRNHSVCSIFFPLVAVSGGGEDNSSRTLKTGINLNTIS